MTIDNALLPVRRTIASVGPDTRPEEIALTLGLLQALGDAVKAMKAELRENMLAWVNANGELTIGDVRYYAGVETDTKCTDAAGVLNALLTATDIDTAAACLSANAWKPGATAKVLPLEVFGRLFTRTVRNVLADGKPRKTLCEVNTRYVAA